MISKFDIINASAGSGKTFALTQRILVKILKSKDDKTNIYVESLEGSNDDAEALISKINELLS